MKRETYFFPDIYNDDWFYLLDAKTGLRQIAAMACFVQPTEPSDLSVNHTHGEHHGEPYRFGCNIEP